MLQQELGGIQEAPVEGTVVRLPNDGDIFTWEVIMTGPAESVYAVCSLCTFSLPDSEQS